MAALLLLKFKDPQMMMYDGYKDPLEHLEIFKAHMTLNGFLGEIACRAFLLILKGATRGWFGAVPQGQSTDSES